MEVYLALLATSLFWFFATGFFGGFLLTRVPESIHPRVGLTLWFGAIYSLAVSLLSAILMGALVILSSYLQLHKISVGSSNFLWVVLASLLPWIALALAGGTIAYTVTKWESAVTSYRSVSGTLGELGSTIDVFRGISIARIELDVPLAMVSDKAGESRVLISSAALNLLDSHELSAVLWHELGHVVGGHNSLKRVAAIAANLLGWLPLARLTGSHTDYLMEREADLIALRNVDAAVLEAARAKLTF